MIEITLKMKDLEAKGPHGRDMQQLVLARLKDAGAPVEGTTLLSLRTGFLLRKESFDGWSLTVRWSLPESGLYE